MVDEFNPKYKVDALIENLLVLRGEGMEVISRNQILSMLIYKPLFADSANQSTEQQTDILPCEKCGGIGDNHDISKHHFAGAAHP